MDLVALCLGPSFDFAEIPLGPNGPRVISDEILLRPPAVVEFRRNHIGGLDLNRSITYKI